ILTNTFPDLVEKRLGADVTSRARALFESMSTVEDALAAASVGLRANGVWAMHDATEGGVRNAVWEMAQASGLGVDVDLSKVIVDPAVAEVSKMFGMEALDAISEGTLLIASEPGAAGRSSRVSVRRGSRPSTSVRSRRKADRAGTADACSVPRIVIRSGSPSVARSPGRSTEPTSRTKAAPGRPLPCHITETACGQTPHDRGGSPRRRCLDRATPGQGRVHSRGEVQGGSRRSEPLRPTRCAVPRQ